MNQWVPMIYGFHCRYDFNADLAGSPEFGLVEAIQGNFDRFLTQCFDPPGEANVPGVEGGKGDGSKAALKSREDPVKKMTRANGTIWIPEITGANRAKLQSMVRGFLTAHYSTCRTLHVTHIS
jgi:hypothetical protein